MILAGCHALVTGASRGAGRGIAVALGEAGATVFVTGRTTAADSPTGRSETIDETATAVTERGGQGIALRCDHSEEEHVESLISHLGQHTDRLDVLVNNAWGGYEHSITAEPFWELSLEHLDLMYRAGLRATAVTTRAALPLVQASDRGLIVNTTSPIRGKYHGNVYYDVIKTAVARMSLGMAEDLRGEGIAVVALAPGWMRTERILEHFKVTEESWQEVQALSETESPEYGGRAVVALAADPDVMERTGQMVEVGELAREYGFDDLDGRRPPPFSEIHPELF
jgi:NAD(P)-dependent dehydrogenase (short-subunit alcohol dehydrogenase family)